METQRPSGLLTIIQQHLDSIFASMHIQACDVIAYVTYFGIGFIAGVAVKRYGKWMVTITLATILLIVLLHYFEIITVHQTKIKELLSLQDVHTLDDAATILQEKMHALLIEIILVSIAVVVGFKLG